MATVFGDRCWSDFALEIYDAFIRRIAFPRISPDGLHVIDR
jgi:hypothetical protein